MEYTIEKQNDGRTRIGMSFINEGVELVAETFVRGDEKAAERYVPTFERDMRHNFSELFPAPPEPEPADLDEEGME